MLEQVALDELKAKTLESRPSPQRTRKFLELVKSLYSNYKIATTSEKREIVKIATSNRMVSGKNVLIEPSTWLHTAQDALGVLLCADDRTTPRSSPEMFNEQFRSLIDVIHSIEATTFDSTSEQQLIGTATNQYVSAFGAMIEPSNRQNRKPTNTAVEAREQADQGK